MKADAVLISGGTGGIGTALVKKFSNEGFHCVVTHNHKSKNELDDWVKLNNFDLNKISFVCFNLNKCQEVEHELLNLLTERRISVLINNAGITDDASFLKMTKLQWDSVLNTNLNSLFSITQIIANSMVKNKSGKIINISSINGLKGQRGQCNYSASKAGMIGFTKSLAAELASKGITVNAIAPGYSLTPMVKKLNTSIIESIKSEIPTKALVDIDEIANVAFMIAKSGLSITGETISINGGHYMN